MSNDALFSQLSKVESIDTLTFYGMHHVMDTTVHVLAMNYNSKPLVRVSVYCTCTGVVRVLSRDYHWTSLDLGWKYLVLFALRTKSTRQAWLTLDVTILYISFHS